MNAISPLITMTYASLNFKIIRLAGVLVEFHTYVPESAFILSLSFQFRTTNPISDITIWTIYMQNLIQQNTLSLSLSFSLFVLVCGNTAATVT